MANVWTFGEAGSGLQFQIKYVDGTPTLVMLEGSMELNALWFSDGNNEGPELPELKGKEKSLNMNGEGSLLNGTQPITWDDYTIVDETGLNGGEPIQPAIQLISPITSPPSRIRKHYFSPTSLFLVYVQPQSEKIAKPASN